MDRLDEHQEVVTTTAGRSRDWLRKQGSLAEVVEHRRGKWRIDLMGLWDVLAVDRQGVIVIQSYLDTKANRLSHAARFTAAGSTLQYLRASKVRMQEHRWKKRRGRWGVEVVPL